MIKNFAGKFLILGVALSLNATLPSVSWSDNAKDDQTTFINKVNALYYNHARQGLKKYKCQVQLDIFETFKSRLADKFKPGDPHLKAVQKVQFLMSYDPKGGVVFDAKGLQPSGDTEFDQQADKVVKGLVDLGSKYLNSYKDLVYSPFLEAEKFDIEVEKTKEGYRVTQTRKDKKDKGTIFLDNQFLAVRFEGDKSNPVAITALPEFLPTPQGFLLKSESDTIKNEQASMDQQMTMDYLMMKGLQMLSTLKTTMRITRKEGEPQVINLDFTFTHYEIN